MASRERLTFSSAEAECIDEYLPSRSSFHGVHLTLTWAASLDSFLSSAARERTIISGPQSKAMTHYLRLRHDAILIGYRTAIADDPALNCRLAGVSLAQQPRPIVIDPWLEWEIEKNTQLCRLAANGSGKKPTVICCAEALAALSEQRRQKLENAHVTLLAVATEQSHKLHGLQEHRRVRLPLAGVLEKIEEMGCRSVMVEGGARLLNSFLEQHSGLVDSIIITLAPKWLGAREGKARVEPLQSIGPLANAQWLPMGNDVVLLCKAADKLRSRANGGELPVIDTVRYSQEVTSEGKR